MAAPHSSEPPRQPRYDLHDLKQRAAGLWCGLFARFGNISSELLDGRHHPCPRCGGTDRFRLIDAHVGTLFCNQCFRERNHDGIAGLRWLTGWSLPQTLECLARELNLTSSAKPASGISDDQAGGDGASAATRVRSPRPDPAAHLEFRDFNPVLMSLWCRRKPGIDVKAIALVGGRNASYRKQYSVVAIPILNAAGDAVGWTLYNQDGRSLPAFRGCATPTQVKVKTTAGSLSGLINAHALRILSDPLLRKDVQLILKVEGAADCLAAQALIPDALRDTHLVLTNSSGCGELPRAWMLNLLASARCPIWVIHDCDVPGQEGALRRKRNNGKPARLGWAPLLRAAGCPDVRNVVLPYPIVESHGKDLRDWISSGGTWERLEAMGLLELSVPIPTQAEIAACAGDTALDLGPSSHQPPPAAEPSVADNVAPGPQVVRNGTPDLEGEITPLPMNEIVTQISRVCGDWPRRVRADLFYHLAGTDEPVWWLQRQESLFAFFSHQTGQPPMIWSKTGCHSKGEIFAALQYYATECRAVETLPHEPPAPDHYYAHSPFPPGDGGTLDELLNLFSPETPIDRDLIKAMLATTIWGGPGGARPMFILTSQAGRGSGKTSLANVVAQLAGGPFEVNAGEDREEIVKRLLSPEGLTHRVVLLDNLKTHRFSWAEVEALVTCREISGRKLYVGEGSRPNLLTWIITLNGVSLSTDVAQRSVIIRLKKPEHDGDWQLRVSNFVTSRQKAIIADLISFLREDPFRLPRHTRWGIWEQAILSRLPDPAEAQQVIQERQLLADVEDEESAMIEDYIWSQLEGLGYAAEQRVFIPTQLMMRWFNLALNERQTATSVTRTLKQKIGESKMRAVSVNACMRWGRGFLFQREVPEDPTNDDRFPVATDVEARLERHVNNRGFF